VEDANEKQSSKENASSENNQTQTELSSSTVFVIRGSAVLIGLIILWHGLNLCWPKGEANKRN